MQGKMPTLEEWVDLLAQIAREKPDQVGMCAILAARIVRFQPASNASPSSPASEGTDP